MARDARFGNKLKPATVNKRLKHHLSFVANLMDCGGLTAYCFRVAGVSQALRKGVEARLLKRHGNWKSWAITHYICDEEEALLSVTDAL